MTDYISRSLPLLDISIQRGGDGRTVEAYAATFDTLYEVSDHEGHYDETIDRAAFNRVIRRGARGVQVLFNHGRTLHGTPSERYSQPLGVALELRAEPKGLLTVTRYSKTPLADETLELIRDGAITAQSFRGATLRSDRPKPGPNGRPVIVRRDLGLMEYGPAPFAINMAAGIVAVRSELLELERQYEQTGTLSEEERARLIALLQQTDPAILGGPSETTAPDNAPAAPLEPEAPAAPEVAPAELDTLLADVANRRRLLALKGKQ